MEIEITIKGEITERERELMGGLESYLGGFLFLEPKADVDTHSKISMIRGMVWQTPGRED